MRTTSHARHAAPASCTNHMLGMPFLQACTIPKLRMLPLQVAQSSSQGMLFLQVAQSSLQGMLFLQNAQLPFRPIYSAGCMKFSLAALTVQVKALGTARHAVPASCTNILLGKLFLQAAPTSSQARTHSAGGSPWLQRARMQTEHQPPTARRSACHSCSLCRLHTCRQQQQQQMCSGAGTDQKECQHASNPA